MCDLCAKGFFDNDFNLADIDKISNFNKIASNFTYSWTSKVIKYNCTDKDHVLLNSKFYGGGISGMYFCIFGSNLSWRLWWRLFHLMGQFSSTVIRSNFTESHHKHKIMWPAEKKKKKKKKKHIWDLTELSIDSQDNWWALLLSNSLKGFVLTADCNYLNQFSLRMGSIKKIETPGNIV